MNFHNAKVFITVGHKEQKNLCEKLILSINKKFGLNIHIISDFDTSSRLGSGGAVLKILHEHYESNKKMLIINSGGMSKRSINYALKGKAFASVFYKSQVVFLLELILKNACKLLNCFDSGVLICCSDILVDIKEPSEKFTDSVGVALKTDISTASRHGVMIYDDNKKLLEYLHKCSADELTKTANALKLDSFPIDTGITYFSSALTDTLYELSCKNSFLDAMISDSFELSLYSDIISLLSKNADKDKYLSRETINSKHRKYKELLYEKLSSFSMSVLLAEEQKFLHFGSNSESLENIFYLSDDKNETLKINSFVSEHCETGKNTLLDGVQLTSCKIGDNCLISDIDLENTYVDSNKSVCGIKLKDGSFVTIICNIDENPKDFYKEKTLWETQRFFKAASFTESLNKYYSKPDDPMYSMAYCVENADYNYFFNRQQYLSDKQDYSVSDNYLKKRAEIISHHFSKNHFIDELVCKKDKVEISLPLRINFSGTWTDAMPYCIDNGGQVINMAVLVDGKKPVKVIVEKLNDEGIIEFCSDSASVIYNLNNPNNDEDLSDFILHKAVLETIGITPDTVIRNGFRLTTGVTGIDKGSGLGTSSILLGGCFIALGEMFDLRYSDSELLNMVFVGEQIMKTGGGWQDQVGGLTPGLKAGTTLPGIEQNLDVTYISVSDFFKKVISEKLVLLPTGQRHFGRFIVNDVVNRYLENNPESLEGHIKIRKLNEMLIHSFETDDYQGFTSCINKHREFLQLISHKVTNDDIEKIVEKCFEKADAVSYLGAGGGGYLLVVLNEETDISDFRSFVRENFPTITSDVKNIDICYDI